ncbi:MAG: cytochrome P450 [Sphingomonadales bacterium]|jgi:cytochrome P450|nr:cytochrome P450 [Sphingomonadales bacterium]
MDDFNPVHAETFDSPHDQFRHLRDTCPVAHTSAWGGFWALTRHEDVAMAAADSDAFITSVQNVVPKVAFTGRRPPLHLDPPEHTPYRRAIAPLMTGRAIARLEPIARQICADLLAPMLAKGGGDICADYGAFLPIRVFAHWMNLEPDQIEELSAVGRRYNIAVQSAQEAETKEASLLLYDMARAILADRKTNPRDSEADATSALLAVRVDGEPLPEDMIVGTIRQVLVVGIIAPTVMIGSIAVHLCRFPDVQAQLRADPSLIPLAVEEFLRLYTPYRGFARTPRHDICLHGRTMKEGEAVALIYASANRDERVFDDPESFRLDRPNMKDSLAFGRGTHMCPGAALARMQLTVALETLLAGTGSITAAGPVIPTRMPEIGALSVPLNLVPRGGA